LDCSGCDERVLGKSPAGTPDLSRGCGIIARRTATQEAPTRGNAPDLKG